MNQILPYSSLQGTPRAPVGGKSASSPDPSFRESLTAARAATDHYQDNALLSPEPGAPSLQWAYEHYIKGSAPYTASLSEEQLQYLSEQIDPEHITQDSYDKFVDALAEMGVFSKDDLDPIFYGEVVKLGTSPTTVYLPYSSKGKSAFGADYEMQEWARANSLLLAGSAVSSDRTAVFSVKRASVLMTLMPIMEKIAGMKS